MGKEFKVSKSKFLEFEKTRQSGICNMFSGMVRELTTLSREEHMFIIKHYDQLHKEYIGGEPNE